MGRTQQILCTYRYSGTRRKEGEVLCCIRLINNLTFELGPRSAETQFPNELHKREQIRQPKRSEGGLPTGTKHCPCWDQASEEPEGEPGSRAHWGSPKKGGAGLPQITGSFVKCESPI
jgi:hypothetical protein